MALVSIGNTLIHGLTKSMVHGLMVVLTVQTDLQQHGILIVYIHLQLEINHLQTIQEQSSHLKNILFQEILGMEMQDKLLLSLLIPTQVEAITET